MTTRQVQEGIHILQSIDPTDPSAYDKAVAAYRQMGNLMFFVLDYPVPTYVFHSRTHKSNNYFEDFSDIGIPPPDYVKSFARCNIPNQPVFYCSDYRPTSYIELVQYWAEETNDEYIHVTIGKWEILNYLRVLIVTSPYANERLAKYDKTHGEKLDRFINQHSGETREAMILLYKFLFDRFRKPAKKDVQTYIITSAYCDLAFNRTKGNIDAILYPSVPYDGKGLNFAIKPDYPIETNMKLIFVARDTFRRINSTPFPTFRQSEFKQARSVDYIKKKIIW